MQDDRVLLCRVAPFGNLRIDAYVPLPVAYRSLSRPSSAPDAKAFPLRSFLLDLASSIGSRFRIMQASFRDSFFLKLYLPLKVWLIKSSTIIEKFVCLNCTRPLLLPCLSFCYCSVFKVHLWVPFKNSLKLSSESFNQFLKVVGLSGLEPPTLRLSVVRSSQLS